MKTEFEQFGINSQDLEALFSEQGINMPADNEPPTTKIRSLTELKRPTNTSPLLSSLKNQLLSGNPAPNNETIADSSVVSGAVQDIDELNLSFESIDLDMCINKMNPSVNFSLPENQTPTADVIEVNLAQYAATEQKFVTPEPTSQGFSLNSMMTEAKSAQSIQPKVNQNAMKQFQPDNITSPGINVGWINAQKQAQQKPTEERRHDNSHTLG